MREDIDICKTAALYHPKHQLPRAQADPVPGSLSRIEVMEARSNLVNRVKVTRIQDASKRRVPFQQKIGAGLTRAQFRAKS